jgi:hypothetical protein
MNCGYKDRFNGVQLIFELCKPPLHVALTRAAEPGP